ncbi:MAG TPA: glutamyl-tRNA reductase [bacterium]|nr:glutamyl-tRNA reductase [bacterium]
MGLTHETAPLALRERAAVGEDASAAVLAQIRNAGRIAEAVLLSTCNRTEFYTVAASPDAASDAFGAFAAARGISSDELAGTVMALHERQAALHAVRVASGLESMIIGEPQILSQVRRAHAVARRYGHAGPILNRLMQTAVGAGGRVRQTTGLSRHVYSVPRAAAALSERAVGPLHGRNVVIVGAGEIAALAAKAFAARGARIAAVCNRTVEAAGMLARQYGAAALSLDVLPVVLPGAAVVVVAVGGEDTVLSAAAFSGSPIPAEKHLIIDLSVPRAVAADAAAVPGVQLLALDDLSGARTAAPSPADLAAAATIADAAASAFVRWRASRAAAPLIAALTGRAARIAEQEVWRARTRLAGLDERQRDAVRTVVLAAMRKLLHTPLVRLRESATDGTSLLSAAEDLFGLIPHRRDEDPT